MNRLSDARKAAGLTQMQLAQRAGLAVSTIRNIEQGVYECDNIRYKTLQAIADTLDVGIDYLRGADDGGQIVARDDFHIVACRILAYLCECLKRGEVPDIAVVAPDVLGISERYWTSVLRMLSDDGFVVRATFNAEDNLIPGSFRHIRITRTGIEFMNENKSMRRALKWLREMKETIPGI